MSTIINYTLDNTNPVNKTVYVESYEILSNSADIDRLMNIVISRHDTIDPMFINHSIDTAYREAFRIYLNKKGIIVRWDTSLRELLSIADMTTELSNHDNIVDLLIDTNREDFELTSILSKLDLESLNLVEKIESYDEYKHMLYNTHMENILLKDE